jgi:glycosyltransferase involved in cell wall biosynthesis
MTKTTPGTISSQGLSVIIPTFNGAQWLPKTIHRVIESLQEAKIDKYEIVVVDDGSTDNSVQVVKDYAREHSLPLRVVSQKNGGRFVARRTGGEAATHENLLFVDTRVFIGKESLSYLLKQHKKDPTRNVWCSHVRVDTAGNIYARFWEAIAYVAWRKYFSNPRDTSYGIDEFDSYPKGTTCFFIKKEILSEANEWFVKNTKDLKTSNDDTLLIRHIAEKHSVNVSPKFWCLYHARSALRPYVKHVFHRGKVFVDGFLRRDGNVFFWPLVGFLLASIIVPVAIIVHPALFLPVLGAAVVAWLLELLLIIALRVPTKDGLSLFVLSPVFGIFYGAGIWKAFLKLYVFGRQSKV